MVRSGLIQERVDLEVHLVEGTLDFRQIALVQDQPFNEFVEQGRCFELCVEAELIIINGSWLIVLSI